MALRLGNRPIVEILLRSGKIELASAEWDNSQALANAAAGGLAVIEYVEQLLPSSSADGRKDALIKARTNSHWHIANLILKYDAKQDEKDSLFPVSESLGSYLKSNRPIPQHVDFSSDIDYREYQQLIWERDMLKCLTREG